MSGTGPESGEKNTQLDLYSAKETILTQGNDLPEGVFLALTNIKENVSDVVSHQDVEFILNYIKKIYAIKNGEIDPKIVELFQENHFRNIVNQYIQKSLPEILNNDTGHSFEDISFFVFLLRIGKTQKILLDLNTYENDKLEELFSYYIENIIGDAQDVQKGETFFLGYVNLFELSNKLSILNEVDSRRKTLIPGVVSILEKKAQELSQKLEQKGLLTLQRKNTLMYMEARLLINFSHIHYINTFDRTLESILHDFGVILDNQMAGFDMAEKSDFGNSPSKRDRTFHTFIGNMAYIMNIMLQKVAHFREGEVLSNPIFLQIVEKIFSLFGKQKHQISSLSELLHFNNNILAGIYFEDNSKMGESDENLGKEAVMDFLSKKGSKSDQQIESIHHLVMFLDNLSVDDYLEIGMYLVNTKKYNNYNFEFFKLKTLDIIISKLIHEKDSENIKILFAKIVIYIENNKVVSQLLNTYSRLYLAIAFYYSNSFDKKYITWALKFFTIFFKMGGDEYDFQKYGKKMEDFYYNIGLYNLKSTLCKTSKCAPGTECSTTNIDCRFDRDEVIEFGKDVVEKYKSQYELEIKPDLDRVLSDLLEKALTHNGIEDSEINQKISVVLSNSIFHGIAKSYIVDVNSDAKFVNELILHNGIDNFQIELINGYKLIFIFPKIYRETFQRIYERESFYIDRNMKNLITSYLKTKADYLDHTTGLPNELKLKSTLSRSDVNVSFIAIKLNTLKSMNIGYSYHLGDEYIRNVAVSLLKIKGLEGRVYRLSGAKIGMVLDLEMDVQEIVRNIKNIKFQIGETSYKLDALIGVVVENNERIVEKSQRALDHAKNSSEGVFYYKENVNDSQEDKELLEYLKKLDKAIEEDRIVPFFQPKVDAKNRDAVVGYEALMRVRNEEGKIEPPFKYLLAAEKFGRLGVIFQIMMKKTFEFASKNPGNFSLNLSGYDLKNEKLLVEIEKTSKEYGIDNSRITFEVLEGEWNEGGSKNLNIIKKLKNLGFKIAMDDYGADNSNQNRLLDLLASGTELSDIAAVLKLLDIDANEHSVLKTIDYLKIDGKIIKALSGENQKIIKEINELEKLIFTDGQQGSVDEEVISKLDIIIDNLIPDEKMSHEIRLTIFKKIQQAGEKTEEIRKILNAIRSLARKQAQKLREISMALISGIVKACNKAGVRTIGEFVEDEKIAVACEFLGVDELQGYHVGKPNNSLEILK